MSYSTDLRKKIMHFVDKDGCIAEGARIFGVSRSTIYNWIKKKKRTGSLKDLPARRGWQKLEPQALTAFVQQHPDFTLAEYARHFGVTPPSMSTAFMRLKITRKKRH